MMGSDLEVTGQEIDLEFMMDSVMKLSSQCSAAVKKANSF